MIHSEATTMPSSTSNDRDRISISKRKTAGSSRLTSYYREANDATASDADKARLSIDSPRYNPYNNNNDSSRSSRSNTKRPPPTTSSASYSPLTQFTNAFSFRRRRRLKKDDKKTFTQNSRRRNHPRRRQRYYFPNTNLLWSGLVVATSVVMLLLLSHSWRRTQSNSSSSMPSGGDDGVRKRASLTSNVFSPNTIHAAKGPPLHQSSASPTTTATTTTTTTTTIQYHNQQPAAFEMHYPMEKTFGFGTKEYGDLVLDFDDDDATDTTTIQSWGRQIDPEDEEWYHETNDFRNPWALLDDDFEPDYVPNEDDYLRFYKEDDNVGEERFAEESPKVKYHPLREGTIGCRRVAMHRLHFPNCNTFHELTLLNVDFTILGEGDFRQAARVSVPVESSTDYTVYKHIHYEQDFDYRDMEHMRLDTMISERLTASPRTISAYGLCGIASLSEFAKHGTIEEDIYGPDEDENGEPTKERAHDDWEPVNDLSNVEKIKYALQMAEAVADLHGFYGGVILHEDIKADQFLWNEDKSYIKLNDFSRSLFLMWDGTTQEYCAYDENECRSFRSPEEYEWSHNLTEKIDVYNLASIFFILLTGRFMTDALARQDGSAIETGSSLVIDPRYKKRSETEAKFVDIIGRCQARKPEDRPSIFELIEELKETLEIAEVELKARI